MLVEPQLVSRCIGIWNAFVTRCILFSGHDGSTCCSPKLVSRSIVFLFAFSIQRLVSVCLRRAAVDIPLYEVTSRNCFPEIILSISCGLYSGLFLIGSLVTVTQIIVRFDCCSGNYSGSCLVLFSLSGSTHCSV